MNQFIAIDTDDYRIMKKDCEVRISRLEEELKKANIHSIAIKSLIEKLMNTLKNVDLFFIESKIDVQRGIISAIYPQKLEIENSDYRTPEVNEGADFIYQLNSILAQNKNGTKLDFSSLSHLVTPLGLEPRTY